MVTKVMTVNVIEMIDDTPILDNDTILRCKDCDYERKNN